MTDVTGDAMTSEDRSGPGDNGSRQGLAGQPRLSVLPRGPWWTRVKTWHKILIIAFEVFIIGVIWQFLIGTLGLINPIFMPTPTRIIEGFGLLFGSGEKSVISATDQAIWVHIRRSAFCYSSGLLIGIVVGIPVGLLIGTSRTAYRLIGRFIWWLYAVPWVALRPPATIWFGFEAAPVIFIVSFAATFPILLNTAAGPQTVDPSLLRSAQVFGAGRFEQFWKVLLPSSLPFIFVGLRQAIVISMISLQVAEIVGSSKGLGALIVLMTSHFKTGAAFAVLLSAALITIFLGQGVRYTAEKLAPWHFGQVRR